MHWDPEQYGRFADERGRPFHELVARIGASAPRRVVDVGCGPGELTVSLKRRWPDAVVEGIDSSAEMIADAPRDAGITFRIEDAQAWQLPADADVVISNAMLQWVPDHLELIARWASALPPGGWLAFQVPGNFDSFSHTLMRSLAESPRWAAQLTGLLRHNWITTPEGYAAVLLNAGLAADVWETTYVHVLGGPDPVLEWLRGSGLRPVLAALPPEDGAEFAAEFGAQLRTAYPSTPHGTLFPFRRIFAVGHRPA